MKKYIAESIGTFALVFFGTGSIIVNQLADNALGLMGIAVVFGTIIMSMIYVFGEISGTHINPVVTISLAINDLMPKKDVLPYLFAQVGGAIFASILLRLIFAEDDTLGATLPTGGLIPSIIMEVIMTYFLMLTILGVTSKKETKPFAGLVIGAYVFGAIFISGPISGGSFNPARSLGPALISGHLESLWIYLLFPIIGGILATFTWKKLQ